MDWFVILVMLPAWLVGAGTILLKLRKDELRASAEAERAYHLHRHHERLDVTEVEQWRRSHLLVQLAVIAALPIVVGVMALVF